MDGAKGRREVRKEKACSASFGFGTAKSPVAATVAMAGGVVVRAWSP